MKNFDRTKFGYTLILSGMTENNLLHVEVGVIYQPNFKSPVSKRQQKISEESVYRVHLPDRTLFFSTRRKSNRGLEHSLQHNFDDYLYLSWQKPNNSANELQNGIVMQSAYYGGREDFSDDIQLALFSDSGGFQLMNGSDFDSDSVGIEDIAKFMAFGVSYGTSLDCPLNQYDYGFMTVLESCAHFQAAADIELLREIEYATHKRQKEIFEKRKLLEKKIAATNSVSLQREYSKERSQLDSMERHCGKLKLLKGMHGYNNQSARRYLDIVGGLQDPYVGWAIGGPDEQKLRTACLLHEQDAKAWLHLYGVSSPSLIPAMIYLGKYAPVSSDASTHFQGAKSLKYLQPLQNGAIKSSVLVGKNYDNHKFQAKLFCDCPICKTVKWSHFFRGEFECSGPVTSALCNHNIYCLQGFCDYWRNELQAVDGDFSRYAFRVKASLGNEALENLSYVKVSLDIGCDNAEEAYGQAFEEENGSHLDLNLSCVSKFTNFPDLISTKNFMSAVPAPVARFLAKNEAVQRRLWLKK